MNKIIEQSFTTLEDLLGYFYDCPHEFTDAELWKNITTVLKMSEESVIISLYTSQSFIFKVFKFLTALPFKRSSTKIIKYVTQYIDPSPQLLKRIVSELIPCLENEIPCLSTLNVCLSFYNSVFEQQRPANQNIDSHIYLYGPEDGIRVREPIKWPFQKGGTLAFWYNMSEKTKQCKLFQFMTEQRAGFEIIMKNRKIYIQKQDVDTKFRLMKNTSAYLCDAIFNKNIKFTLEFETRKKFFQAYLSINIIMNNFVLNGVDIDSIPLNNIPLKMSLFKNFYGKFYAALILTQKLAGQVDQMNSQTGFIFQSDIRNFSYLFEKSNEKILMLYSAIRSKTIFEEKAKVQEEVEIDDELKQKNFDHIKPLKTILYDVIGTHIAEVGTKACCYINSSIGKEIGNYGGFQSILPFIDLLEICCCSDELYRSALNQFLELVKSIFENKTDSIEKAYQLKFFKLLSSFIEKTKMQGFSYETITRLKQIYIALNTRMLRQKYIQEVVWGVNFGLHLDQQNFNNYIKFIKTFYNEDIQSSLHTFDITKIFLYIIENLDSLDCCFEHVGYKSINPKKIKNYPKILMGIFEIIQNVMLIKRSEPDLNQIIKQILQIFGNTISPCLIEALLDFIKNLFIKDSVLQLNFLHFLQKQNPQCKFYLYKCLSGCNSWKTKKKIIQFMLKVLEPSFFEETKNEKEMLALCARYPTMNYLRSSSVKSRQDRDSIEYSEEKLSLNSATMHKLIIINPIQNKDELLVNDQDAIEAITKWTFSEAVLKRVSDQHENPGLIILMELYKGSTYKLRMEISKTINENMKIIRFGPELMAWAIQCALMAEFDLHQTQKIQPEITTTKQNLIQIISNYDFYDAEDQLNNEIMIIKLVFSSVKSKYPDQIVKTVGNKLFFIICERKMHMFVQNLKNHDHINTQSYDKLCWRIISNVTTFINQYYVIKGDDDETQFDEQMAQILENQNHVIIEIMEKILQIYVLAATFNDLKIIEEANAERNHLVVAMIFSEKEKQKEKVNIFFQILFALQTIFDFFEDVDFQPKKKCLVLIRKYVIFVIELTENSGNAKLQHLEQDLKNILLLSLSFFEQKYYQYFYYPYERHKNLDFQVESTIKRSINEIKHTIFTIFLDFIELMQYIDEKGNLQHKSFYELMKPKRKHVHKYSLKNIYPNFWKKADEKIIEFLCLKRETLRKDAHQKLQSHIILKKISQFCANTQKVIAKRLFNFVESERKQSDARQRKSVNFYKITQSQKCKYFSQCEEELTQFRLKISEEERLYFAKQKQYKDIQKRQLKQTKKKIWNQNRCFENFWANKYFYQFSQTQPLKADNSLKKFYERVRCSRQSKYFLMPFLKIQAIQIRKSQCKQQPVYISINQNFLEGITIQKVEKRRTSQKLINGLQFIKKKVYEKLVRTITLSSQKLVQIENESERIFVEDVLWIQPMRVYAGCLKIQSGKISYCHKSSKKFEHISLFKNHLHQSDILIREWNVFDIEGFIIKKFMLKQNSIQIYFKNRKSIFLCFHGSLQEQFSQILLRLQKICSFHSFQPQQILIKAHDPLRLWDKLQITEKWMNYEISNFEYLMCLNIASGRTNCDLNQYPVMPWIFSQYRETKAKKNSDKYRDFNKNTALLGNEQRIKKFQQTYESTSSTHSDEFPVPHYFGFHYSNMGIILQYLIRLNPYSEGAKCLQGGKFDIPDRLFYSIPESFKCITSQISDLRQLVPQFFYMPEFLINYENFDFGKLQNDRKVVNHVELPDGCMNAFDFIEHHREGLESKEVSANLHKWIDLIFGYKNSGKQAEKNINTYHYLTNQTNSQIVELIEDQQKKEALQSQMAYYGKTPSQLFSKPHPQRPVRQKISFDEWQKQAFSINQHFNPLFSFQNTKIIPQILCFSYCEKTKKYLLLSKNGKGIVFVLDQKQLRKINEFTMTYHKAEGINITNNHENQTLPTENLQAESIAIGGLWGGKILIYNLTTFTYDLIQKHTSNVSVLKYSPLYNLLFSGAANGQLCKWIYKDKKLHFLQKINCYSRINSIQVDEDLKIVATCTQEGGLWLISIEHLEIIRVIKVSQPIIKFAILRMPFYHVVISCHNNCQFCYSINGTKLQECEMEAVGQLLAYQFDYCEQKIIIEIGNNLVFMKTPQFSIQQKLEVGIGDSSFKFIANEKEILVINQAQMLVWRRPIEQPVDRTRSF